MPELSDLEKIREEIRHRITSNTETPWDKLEGESDTQFLYFTYYLSLEPKHRTLINAANTYRRDKNRPETNNVPGPWIEAKRKFDWDNRVALYDQFLKQDLRNYVEHQQYTDLIKFRQRQRELSDLITSAAFALVERAMEALNDLGPEDLRPATIANYIKTATQVADFAHNLEAQSYALNKILEKINNAEDDEISDLVADIDFDKLDSLESELLTNNSYEYDEENEDE
jgi:hypothetical protein